MTGEERFSPVHRSLNEPQQIGGVERKLFILNMTLHAAMVFGMKQMFFVATAVMLHVFMRYVTKKDPLITPIYKQRIGMAETYDPWPHTNQVKGRRPHGFSRNNLC